MECSFNSASHGKWQDPQCACMSGIKIKFIIVKITCMIVWFQYITFYLLTVKTKYFLFISTSKIYSVFINKFYGFFFFIRKANLKCSDHLEDKSVEDKSYHRLLVWYMSTLDKLSYVCLIDKSDDQ